MEKLAEVSLLALAHMTVPEIHHVSLGVRQLFSAVDTTQSKVLWCPGGILGQKRAAVQNKVAVYNGTLGK